MSGTREYLEYQRELERAAGVERGKLAPALAVAWCMVLGVVIVILAAVR